MGALRAGGRAYDAKRRGSLGGPHLASRTSVWAGDAMTSSPDPYHRDGHTWNGSEWVPANTTVPLSELPPPTLPTADRYGPPPSMDQAYVAPTPASSSLAAGVRPNLGRSGAELDRRLIVVGIVLVVLSVVLLLVAGSQDQLARRQYEAASTRSGVSLACLGNPDVATCTYIEQLVVDSKYQQDLTNNTIIRGAGLVSGLLGVIFTSVGLVRWRRIDNVEG